MEKTGVLTADGNLNRERAIELEWSSSEDNLDVCETQARSTLFIFITSFKCTYRMMFFYILHCNFHSDQTNPCWKAYALTKCVATANLVDGRKVDE